MNILEAIYESNKNKLYTSAASLMYFLNKGFIVGTDDISIAGKVMLNKQEEVELLQYQKMYEQKMQKLRLYTAKHDGDRFHLVFAETELDAYNAVYKLFKKAPMKFIDITSRQFRPILDHNGVDVYLDRIEVLTQPYYIGLYFKGAGYMKTPREHKYM